MRDRLGWPARRPVCLFVGRFVEKKGLPIVRAMAEQFGDCLWAIAGRGPEDPGQWALPNVVCLGAVEHAALGDYYRAADLLVLPSVGEGFPLVVQEAMACGTPAVISRATAAGMPGVEAACHTAAADAGSFGAAFGRFLAARENWAERRSLAARFAERHWDWERCADRYEEIFRDLAGNAAGDGWPRGRNRRQERPASVAATPRAAGPGCPPGTT